MSDEGTRAVRQAVLGADRGLRLAGGGAGAPSPPDDAGSAPPCPVVALGHADGDLVFLDARGQKRVLSARALGSRQDMLLLFGGDDTWLLEHRPKRIEVVKPTRENPTAKEWVTVDFSVNAAAAALQRACFAAGLFGDHIAIRKPGIWRGPDGMPAVHCGDAVLLGDAWHYAGARTGNQIWAAAPPTPRPGIPCDVAVARELQDQLTQYWNWSQVGAPTAIVGLLGNAYLGAAPRWRPSSYFIGETGSGKSAAHDVIVAALPLHHHSNDSTKPGIEQAVNGRAMPIIIDETADRANRAAGRDLADLVLSASGGEGTRGTRGTADGKGRTIELAGQIIMFAINPPDLEPQHLGRLTLIESRAPRGGEDHRAQHDGLAHFARRHGPALWGRMLAGWERYNAALERFRDGLGEAGCAPRERDQAGALLAGWWVLTEEGLPSERGVRAGISALHGGAMAEPGLIRNAADIEDDSRPRRMLAHLAASMIALHRSSEREPLGKLAEIAWGAVDLYWVDDAVRRSPDDALMLLMGYGMRVVRRCVFAGGARLEACTCRNCHGKRGPIPRASADDGIWFSTQNPELKKLFAGSAFEGERWRYEMARLPSAHRSARNIRIGSVPGRAIWLSRADFLGADDGGAPVAT